MGPGITKVRSLKMDRKVWTEELIEVLAQTDPESPFGGRHVVPSPWRTRWLGARDCRSTAVFFQPDPSPLG